MTRHLLNRWLAAVENLGYLLRRELAQERTLIAVLLAFIGRKLCRNAHEHHPFVDRSRSQIGEPVWRNGRRTGLKIPGP
jgi:hypothetical protein